MGKKFNSYYEKYKEQVTFQTMVVGTFVVLTNGSKTLIIDGVL